jgi:hypothetical protein
VPQTTYTFTNKKWGVTIFFSRSISNVSPQKAFNVIAILIPSHENFEETPPNT